MNVTVYELVTRPDGSIGIGSSQEVPVSDAILMIETEQATSCICPRGVVPDEWRALLETKVEEGDEG
jgi:hypothetical protein